MIERDLRIQGYTERETGSPRMKLGDPIDNNSLAHHSSALAIDCMYIQYIFRAHRLVYCMFILLNEAVLFQYSE